MLLISVRICPLRGHLYIYYSTPTVWTFKGFSSLGLYVGGCIQTANFVIVEKLVFTFRMGYFIFFSILVGGIL